MTDPSVTLDQIDARTNAATEGPWHHQPWGGQNENGDYSGGEVFSADGEYLVHDISDTDGAFIAAARTDVPRLTAALRAVLDLHKPVPLPHNIEACEQCETLYPCRTRRRITAHLGDNHE